LNSEIFKNELTDIVFSRFPLIFIQTFEEFRFQEMLSDLTKDQSQKSLNCDLYIYSQVMGLKKGENGDFDQKLKSPNALLDHIESFDNPAIFLLPDFGVFLENYNHSPESYLLVRRLKETSEKLRKNKNRITIVITGSTITVPEPIQKDTILLDMPLPDQEEIMLLLEKLILEVKGKGKVSVYLTKPEKEKLCQAALGLTLREAEGAIRRSMVTDGTLDIKDIDFVLEQKQQILKKSGALEYVGTEFNMDDLGGLENLKSWLTKRNSTWSEEAKKYSLPAPKGILVTGIPGCGKSLCAKAISGLWKIPLLRFDIGSIYGRYVGDSESNLKRALNSAEMLSPCILWIDEIEKGLGDVSDSTGVSQRVFGNLLTWIQEKKSPVFIFATANNINKLPAELLRKGRFDEIFFVDLPSSEERKHIFKIHLEKRLKNPDVKGDFQIDDFILIELASLTEGFIGAEIEQVIISALYEAFYSKKPFLKEDLIHAIKVCIPLSVSQKEYIQSIQHWANERAIRT
jgi:AAA+ superfamily predicted ATPase